MTKQPYAKQAAFLALHGDEEGEEREAGGVGRGWGGGARRATGEPVGTKKGARALIPLPLRDDRREGRRDGGRRGKKKWSSSGRGRRGGG